MDAKVIIIIVVLLSIAALVYTNKAIIWINDKLFLNLSKSTYYRWIVCITALLVFIIAFNTEEQQVQSYDYRDEIKDRYKKKEKEVLAKIKEDSPKRTYNPQTLEERVKDIIYELNGEMDIESKGNIIAFLDKVDRAKDLLHECSKDTLKKKLNSVLISFQKKHFPKARKAYYQNAKNELWEKDIEVSISGKNLTFTGYMFVQNKVIKDTYSEIQEETSKLRFKTVGFRAFDGDDKTYWELNAKDDSKI